MRAIVWTATRLMLAMLAAAVGTTVGMAQSGAPPTKEQLVEQLKCRAEQDCQPPPTSRKRGFNPVSGARSFRFEANTEAGRQEIEQRVKTGKLPSADLEVYFDYNSSDVRPEAKQALAVLGAALTDPSLAGHRFVLVGHTDALGGDAFNQRLSEQRAAAVKAYLVRQFAIAPDGLDAYGRGKSLLKKPAEPLAAENRRVQVINQGAVVGEAR